MPPSPEAHGRSGVDARSLPARSEAGPSPAPVDPTLRLDAVILGRVQGVGFRYFVVDRARALGLAGWVANRPDGSVRCVAEGLEPDLRALLRALWDGPPGARVSSVTDAWSSGTGGLDGFTVRPGGHPGD